MSEYSHIDHLQVVILAAGKGTRMCSERPKVCHRLAGKMLLDHVIGSTKMLSPKDIFVICGYGKEQVQAECGNGQIRWVEQLQQLGTAHAVAQALPYLDDDSRLLVLLGDVPGITHHTLLDFLSQTPLDALGMITAHVDDPTGLGRVVRADSGQQVQRIVEERDADRDVRNIQEIFSGIMCLPVKDFSYWWPKLTDSNAQGEFYLTELVACFVSKGRAVVAYTVDDEMEVQGINDKLQLAQAERYHQARLVEKLLEAGVTVYDPVRLDIRGHVTVGRDVEIDLNVLLQGDVQINDGCYIGPHCVIKDSQLGYGVVIEAQCVIEGAVIGDGVRIGPFARVRPGTHLQAQAKIGNFVEIKNSNVGKRSKINHLSYVGDAQIGCDVNIGAGTITCNYDGQNKHTTTLEDGVFIGSNTSLVAPVTIGQDSTVGAGTTVTQDVPRDTLAVGRERQKHITHWQSPRKRTSKV